MIPTKMADHITLIIKVSQDKSLMWLWECESHLVEACPLRQTQLLHAATEAIANMNADADGVAHGKEKGQGDDPVGQAKDPV